MPIHRVRFAYLGWLIFLPLFAARAEGPWDIAKLSAAPHCEWVNDQLPVRPLIYEGEVFQGKPAKVFAWYASPATLHKTVGSEKYPGIVLIHGGGGTAYQDWVELWAKRGYAGHRDGSGRLPVGHQDRGGQTDPPGRRRARTGHGGKILLHPHGNPG